MSVRACMASGILHDFPAQEKTDSLPASEIEEEESPTIPGQTDIEDWQRWTVEKRLSLYERSAAWWNGPTSRLALERRGSPNLTQTGQSSAT